MKGIPPGRLLIYFIIFGLLPVAGATYYNVTAMSQLKRAQYEVAAISRSVILKSEKQSTNRVVRQQYEGANHFYIDTYLEPIQLLKQECDDLTQLVAQDPSLPNKDILRRLSFLTDGTNQLHFTEGVVDTFANVQETVETLSHSVEVDLSDLQQILACVDQVKIGDYSPGADAPQLLVSDMRLKRRQLDSGNEVFTLDLKLIKREFM